MTIHAGLNKTLKALRPLDILPEFDRMSYEAVDLLDKLITSRDFIIHTHRDPKGNVLFFEVIPGSSDSYAIKAELDVILAGLTTSVREGRTDVLELPILAIAGYLTAVRKVSLDEWEILIETRHGRLYTRFISA